MLRFLLPPHQDLFFTTENIFAVSFSLLSIRAVGYYLDGFPPPCLPSPIPAFCGKWKNECPEGIESPLSD